MTKNDPIQIQPVSNGFIVREVLPPDYAVIEGQDVVFQTFAELTAWLANHFAHRSTSVKVD